MAVKFKYRDESEVIFNNADDYKFTIINRTDVYWVSFGTYFDEYFYQDTRVWYAWSNDPSVTIDFVTFRDPDTGRYYNDHWCLVTSTGNKFALRPYDEVSSINDVVPPEIRYFIEDPRNQTSTDNDVIAVQRGLAKLFYAGTGQSGRIREPFDYVTNTPSMSVTYLAGQIPDIKFEVFEEGDPLYERVMPYGTDYVRIYDLKCPANTCPVLCNLRVCCYGSDGIAVKTFSFRDSIYQ